jgi:hypothetical protein
MKNLLYLILITLCILPGCGGGDDDPGTGTTSEATQALATMSASPWNMKSVTIDGVAKNNLYTGLKLTITSTGAYSATNGGAVWVSGNITVSSDGKSFTRTDGTAVAIDNLSSSEMVLSLNWTKNTVGSGRSESVAGKHLFTFGK